MSHPVLVGFLVVLTMFATGASLIGLLLDRAVRCPGMAAAVVVVAMLGLSWGGAVLMAR